MNSTFSVSRWPLIEAIMKDCDFESLESDDAVVDKVEVILKSLNFV